MPPGMDSGRRDPLLPRWHLAEQVGVEASPSTLQRVRGAAVTELLPVLCWNKRSTDA